MGNFKKYLQESEDLYNMICDMLEELSDEEIQSLGEFIFHEYFEGDDEKEHEDYSYPFVIDDIKCMVKELGEDHYESLIYFLQPDDFEDDEEEGDTTDHDTHHKVNEDDIDENVFKKSVKRVRNIKLRKDKKKRSGVWKRFTKAKKRMKGSARTATMGGGTHRKKLKNVMRKILKKKRKKRMNV